MASSGNGSNYFPYLWLALIFAITTSVLACYFSQATSDASADLRLDERALYLMSVILILPTCFAMVISCPMIYKGQPQGNPNRHRFVKRILVGLVIFSLGTIVNSSVQIMADVQILILSRSFNDDLGCSDDYKKHDHFDECNCTSYLVILHHAAKLLFVLLQTIFLSLVAYRQPNSRLWLRLLVSTILAVDMYLVLWGLIYRFRYEQYQEDKLSPLFPDFPGVPYDLKDKCEQLAETAFFYKLRTGSIQWLYPLQGEFFLCASGLLLSAWHLMSTTKSSDAGSTDSVSTSVKSTSMISTAPKARNPCRGTVLSTSIGSALAAIFLTASIVLYIVPLKDCDQVDDTLENATIGIKVEDVMAWHGFQWIAYRIITIGSTAAILLELVCCHETRSGHFGIDMWVLGVFLPFVLIPNVMELITAAHFQSSACTPWLHAQLTITSSILALMDALLQTCLVFYGSQFSFQHRRHVRRETYASVGSEDDPLVGQRQNFCITKHLLTFLAVCDASVWVVQSLEALNKQMRTFSAPSQYFGAAVWLDIVSCLNPVLALFYFHLFACFLELFESLNPKLRAT